MPSTNAEDLLVIWQLLDTMVRNELKMPELAYNLFFGNLHLISLDSRTAVFACEHEKKQEVLKNRYADTLGTCLEKVLGYRPDVVIEVDHALAPELPKDGDVISPVEIAKIKIAGLGASPADTPKPAETPAPPSPAPEKPVGRNLTYNEDYTFENFFVGDSNSFAHSAAMAVAENIGRKINPLFIYGDSGLGKTHLMYAIANKALQRDPNMSVIFVKGEDFMNELIEAIRVQSNAAFREKYRKADMLLIDDIQFIAGKDSTQTEFFHTFDALYEAHKQIVLTSDKPPKDMAGLEERIRSRFESGLIADIQPPDYELRTVILKSKAAQSGLDIPTEVIDFLAQNIQSNIRQIDGVIKKLGAKNLLSGMPITMDMVLTTVPEYLRDTEPVGDTVKRIVAVVSKRLNVSVNDIMGDSRKKPIKNARNISMYIIRSMTQMSLPQIGTTFGRDHSTVHSNISMVENQIVADSAFEASINEIIKEIKRS